MPLTTLVKLLRLKMASLQSARSQCCCCAVGVFAAMFGIFMLSAGICIVVNADFMEVDTSGLPPDLHNDEGKRIVGVILIIVAIVSLGVSATVSILYFTLCNRKPITHAVPPPEGRNGSVPNNGNRKLGSSHNNVRNNQASGSGMAINPALNKLRYHERPHSRESAKSNSQTSLRSSTNRRISPPDVKGASSSGHSPATGTRGLPSSVHRPNQHHKRRKKTQHLRPGRYRSELTPHTEEESEVFSAGKPHADEETSLGSREAPSGQCPTIAVTEERRGSHLSTNTSETSSKKSADPNVSILSNQRHTGSTGSLTPVSVVDEYTAVVNIVHERGVMSTVSSTDYFEETSLVEEASPDHRNDITENPRLVQGSMIPSPDPTPRTSDFAETQSLEASLDRDFERLATLPAFTERQSTTLSSDSKGSFDGFEASPAQSVISDGVDTQVPSALKSSNNHEVSIFSSSTASSSSSSDNAQKHAAAQHPRFEPYIREEKSADEYFTSVDLQMADNTLNDSQFMQDSQYLHDSQTFVHPIDLLPPSPPLPETEVEGKMADKGKQLAKLSRPDINPLTNGRSEDGIISDIRSESRSSFNSAFSNDGDDPDHKDMEKIRQRMKELMQ